MAMDGTQHKQIYWRSRRGMLEVEAKLVPFVRDHFDDLDADEQRAYEAMLAEEDWQIFDWLQGRETPTDETLKRVIAKIVDSKGTL
jgi:antitoxin CptB